MLTHSQVMAIRDHVALDERTQELIRLANSDLYLGPLDSDEGEVGDWPGFAPACHMIRDAFDGITDLYIDTDTDDVIGDTEPSFDPDDECSYSPDMVIHVDSRQVVRALVGAELAGYV
jgi:hypothetical protein